MWNRIFSGSCGKKGLRNNGLESWKGDAAKRKGRVNLSAGARETCHRHTASSSRTVESVALCTTIFGRGVFLSLALGVPKGAISRRKKRAVSCHRLSPFTMQLGRCSTSRTIEKENMKGRCACVCTYVLSECVRSFSTNWDTGWTEKMYFNPDKASRLKDILSNFYEMTKWGSLSFILRERYTFTLNKIKAIYHIWWKKYITMSNKYHIWNNNKICLTIPFNIFLFIFLKYYLKLYVFLVYRRVYHRKSRNTHAFRYFLKTEINFCFIRIYRSTSISWLNSARDKKRDFYFAELI